MFALLRSFCVSGACMSGAPRSGAGQADEELAELALRS